MGKRRPAAWLRLGPLAARRSRDPRRLEGSGSDGKAAKANKKTAAQEHALVETVARVPSTAVSERLNFRASSPITTSSIAGEKDALTGNGRLPEQFRAFTTTFVPYDNVNQVNGSKAGEKTKE